MSRRILDRRRVILFCGVLVAALSYTSPVFGDGEEDPETACVSPWVEGCTEHCVYCDGYCSGENFPTGMCKKEWNCCAEDQACTLPQIWNECSCEKKTEEQ